MARLFNDAANDFLYINNGILTAAPISVSGWARTDADVTVCPFYLGDKDTNNEYFCLIAYDVAGGNIIRALTRSVAGGVTFADSSTTITQGTWFHFLAVFAAANDRRVYLNGGGKGTDNGNVTPAGVDRFAIGVFAQPSIGYYMSGDIAEVAIWNTALTDDDALVLAEGISPLLVKSQSLVGYWPLIRGLNDRINGYTLTASGTAVSPSPRILTPTSPMRFGVPVAAGEPTGIMTLNTGFWGATY